MNAVPARLTRTLIASATAAALALTCAALAAPAAAQSMHIETGGRGQVLIFPYYTVRNGTTSFLSLVNQTTQAKALRVRVRESLGGRPVAELNVFLSPKDVWTAGIVATADGAALISNDQSCTNPKLGGSDNPLTFSNAAYALESTESYATRDRTREGYLEVIEMAAVSIPSRLGTDVTHVAGRPACRFTDDAGITFVQDSLAGPTISVAAPSGGIVGSMSFISVADGASVSYNATAINGFWKTGPGAPVAKITSINSATPDLTSGGNTTITVTDKGKTYVSTFERSIDAVSALFMNLSVLGEYAFTADGTISSAWVVTSPTKPYYVYGVLRAPFQNLYVPTLGKGSCDDYSLISVDREEFVGVSNGDLSVPLRQMCDVANAFGFTPNRTAFDSPRTQTLSAVQAQGTNVPVPGKEGGHLAISTPNVGARLVPISSFVLARSATTGELAWTPAAHTYFGLPMLGFALNVAKYNTGSPQQNYGNLNPLSTQRDIR